MKNRQDFAHKLRDVYESQDVIISPREADVQIDNFFETLTLLLEKDNKISIHGLFTVEKKERAERKGKHPQTKEEIVIPAGHRLSLKLGKKIRDRVL